MKAAIVMINPAFLLRLMKEGSRKIQIAKNSLPQDAKVSGAGPTQYAADYGMVALVVESEEFADIPEGNPLPILPAPMFEMSE